MHQSTVSRTCAVYTCTLVRTLSVRYPSYFRTLAQIATERSVRTKCSRRTTAAANETFLYFLFEITCSSFGKGVQTMIEVASYIYCDR